MCVDVEEPGGGDQSVGVDGRARRSALQQADSGNAIAANAYIGGIPGSARAIHHMGIDDQEIIAWLLRCQWNYEGKERDEKSHAMIVASAELT